MRFDRNRQKTNIQARSLFVLNMQHKNMKKQTKPSHTLATSQWELEIQNKNKRVYFAECENVEKSGNMRGERAAWNSNYVIIVDN